MSNFRFITSAVPEILGEWPGPRPLLATFHFSGLVSFTINLRVKFEVCIFNRSKGIKEFPKFQKYVTWPRPRPIWPIFHFLGFTFPYDRSVCKIWGLYLQPFQRYYGVPKFKNYITWTRSRYFGDFFYLFFIFLWLSIPYGQSACKMWGF